MPVVDPELLAPLSKISDILLKRPGKVSIEGIRRLSNIYGFETFNDTVPAEGSPNFLYSSMASDPSTPFSKREESGVSSGNTIDRLSLSGKILLIDIDFQGNVVKNVSLSSAINLQPIDDTTYDFLEGDTEFEKVESVLYRNLQYNTLDKFNKNLRILSQFDRLSLSAPNDLFNLFNQLTYNLKNLYDYEFENTLRSNFENEEAKEFARKDILRGCLGSGSILFNQNDQIGLFLKIWEDNRQVNDYLLKNNNIRTEENLNPYLIHFKITESIKNHTENMNSGLDDSVTNNGDSNSIESFAVGGFDESIQPSGISNNGNDDIAEDNSLSRPSGIGGLKLKWFENGDWLINPNDNILNSNLNLLVLEISPNIWIPEDLMMELNLRDYEIINHDNEFNLNNSNEFKDRDAKLDVFYEYINTHHAKELNLESGKKFKLNYLVGCKMVKLVKVKFNRLDRLVKLVETLRNWALLNNFIRNCLNKTVHYDTANHDANLAADESGNVPLSVPVSLGNTSHKSEDKQDDVLDFSDDLRLTEIMKENSELLLVNDDGSGNGNGNTDGNSTNVCVITIENLKVNEINVISRSFKFNIKNGQIGSHENKYSKMIKELAISEDLSTVLRWVCHI